DLFASRAEQPVSKARYATSDNDAIWIQNRDQAGNADPQINTDTVENLASHFITLLRRTHDCLRCNLVEILTYELANSARQTLKHRFDAQSCDCRAAGERLETAPVATTTICSFRFDRHMADLACRSICTKMDTAADGNPSTDPGSESHSDH